MEESYMFAIEWVGSSAVSHMMNIDAPYLSTVSGTYKVKGKSVKAEIRRLSVAGRGSTASKFGSLSSGLIGKPGRLPHLHAD